VITHGDPARTRAALSRVVELAAEHHSRILMPPDELAKHPGAVGRVAAWDEPSGPCDLCLVLGGDGTMLRALHRFLGTDVPVIGVNYGRVGFLTSIMPDEIDQRLPEVLRGEYDRVGLSTIDVHHQGRTHVAINDVLVTAAVHGRMALLEWAVNGISMGERGCDGVVIATPIGSTGYNLSAGGPVLSWGVDAISITFIAPHALDLRPLIVTRSHVINVTSRSIGFAARVVVDGHVVGSLEHGSDVSIRLGNATGILAVLPDRPFLARYRATFGR
jgi:NAD+ kinase